VLDKSATVTPPPTTVTRAENTVPRNLKKYLALDDFEATARRRIPKFLYGYISGGAESDAAVRDPDTAEAPTLVGVEALAADHITVEVAGIEPASNVVL